jgi:hypothetical protein
VAALYPRRAALIDSLVTRHRAMRRPRRNNPIVLALWANAVALAIVGIAIFSRSNSPRDAINFPDFASRALAQNQMPIGGGAGLFIVPAQFSSTTFGCYIMDVDAQTLSAYWYEPPSHQLHLVASRNFRFDRRLGNYNTIPAPMEIKALVDKEQAELRGAETRPTPPSPEKKD